MTFKGEFLIKKVSKPTKVVKALYPSVKWNFVVKSKHETCESSKNAPKWP